MTKLEALKELLAKVECSAEPIDIMDSTATAFPPENAYGANTFHSVLPAFNGSLDAAKALHDAVLPEHRWQIRETSVRVWDPLMLHEIELGTLVKTSSMTGVYLPARAWLICILKALIAKEQEA